MATSLQSPGPQPAPGGGVTLPPTQGAPNPTPSTFHPPPSTLHTPYHNPLPPPEKIQSKFDLSIALTLSTWPALTLAVQNSWGGPQSSEKRDWFAGAISDLFASHPDPNDSTIDVEYLEEFLLQVMMDEFEVNVEDDSAAEVASKIVGLRKLTAQGDFGMVDEMLLRWREREARGGEMVRFQRGQGGEEDEEDSEGDSEEVEDDGDVEMEEAPQLAKVPKEKVMPKVDEEGFIEVINKKR
ncbi:MAG: hypothetical protein LQ338_001999 [Usnochroma carphineum]|nr:MAG: hypothetical protein LQ338_001999 [Usnochroma carphineum]